ncbi:hypothetical protein D3C77_624210 [compost metagenome]
MPPSRSAVMKLPMLSTNTNTAPAAIPGTLSGRMIRRKVIQPEAPRSFEASHSSLLIRDSDEKIARITKGM